MNHPSMALNTSSELRSADALWVVRVKGGKANN
jgi:hypothetical protein